MAQLAAGSTRSRITQRRHCARADECVWYDSLMDGVHDMGGVDGFGKIEVEKNEPVFHAEWEGQKIWQTSCVRRSLQVRHRVAVRGHETFGTIDCCFCTSRWYSGRFRSQSGRGTAAATRARLSPARVAEHLFAWHGHAGAHVGVIFASAHADNGRIALA